MENSKLNEVIKIIPGEKLKTGTFQMPRFSPALFASSFTALTFIRNLGQEWYQIFIPSILVYGIGAAILGTLHRLIALSYERPKLKDPMPEIVAKKEILIKRGYCWTNNEITIPCIIKCILYFLHSAWFGLFVLYLIHRKIIWI